MAYYEYKVIPAPEALPRRKGVRGVADRYAAGFCDILNDEGLEGWEFQSTEEMNVTAKAGLLSRPRSHRMTMLVFRRWVEEPVAQAGLTPVAPPHAEPADPGTEPQDAGAPRTVLRADRGGARR